MDVLAPGIGEIIGGSERARDKHSSARVPPASYGQFSRNGYSGALRRVMVSLGALLAHPGGMKTRP